MDKTKIAVDIFNKLASSYQNKFMDVSMYHNSFDIFCDSIQKQSPDVLELACGPGNITQYLLKKRPDLNILGTDLAPNMIELAKLNNPNAMFEIVDSRAITKLNKTFDALMCGFILPYLSQEETTQLISDSAKVLNENGVIYLSTMEDDYSKSGFRKGSTGDEIYMHYHQATFLKGALLANNFQIIDLQRQVYPGPNDEEVVDLILIANKK